MYIELSKEVRPKGLNSDHLEAAVTTNSATTAREFNGKFNVSHGTVRREIKTIGTVLVVGKWVAHDLSPENRQQRIDYCKSLLASQLQVLFLQACYW